jgi:hypothetical protein
MLWPGRAEERALVTAQQKNTGFYGKGGKKGRQSYGTAVFLFLDSPHRSRDAKAKADQQKSAHLASCRVASHE